MSRKDLKMEGKASSQVHLPPFYSLTVWAVLFPGFKPIKFWELGAGRRREIAACNIVLLFTRSSVHFCWWIVSEGGTPPTCPSLPEMIPDLHLPPTGPLRGAGEAHSSLSPISFPPWQWHSYQQPLEAPKLTSILSNAKWQTRVCWVWIFKCT